MAPNRADGPLPFWFFVSASECLKLQQSCPCKRGQQSHLIPGCEKSRDWFPSSPGPVWQLAVDVLLLSFRVPQHVQSCQRPSYRNTDSQSLIAVLWVLISISCSCKVPQALLGFYLQVYPFFLPEKEVLQWSVAIMQKSCLLQGFLQIPSIVMTLGSIPMSTCFPVMLEVLILYQRQKAAHAARKITACV